MSAFARVPDNESECSDDIPLLRLRQNKTNEQDESEICEIDDEDEDPDWEMVAEDATDNCDPEDATSDDCDPAPSCSNHPQPETTEIASSGQRPSCRPEDYQVEGPPRVSSGQSPAKQNKRSDKEMNRKLVKENRNLGHAYVSEKSRKQMPARRILKERCSSSACYKKHLNCADIDEEHRMSILNTYYDLGDLSKQRQWIAKHITPVPVAKAGSGRKSRTLKYTLPMEDGTHAAVCKVIR